MKILMICLGNICRSPLAEGIMKAKAQAHQLDWKVDSAGTGSWHSGERPDSRSIHTGRNHGIDIAQQRARQVRQDDFDNFDLILAMDSNNYEDLRSLAKTDEHRSKVAMILNFLHPGEDRNVPDPYYHNHLFEEVFQMLDAACERIIEQFRSDALPKT
jgi:protein-tyrosine phosphatase